MLSDFSGAEKAHICYGYIDLRQGIDGLSALVKLEYDLGSFSNTLFLFCGRRRDRINAMYWESNGFVLLYKRLESDSFQWSRKESEARALTPQQYRWLMERLSIDQPKAHALVRRLEIVNLRKHSLRFGEVPVVPIQFAANMVSWKQQKQGEKSPLYRQKQEVKRQGIPLSRQTISNWIPRAAADYLMLVYNTLHAVLLRREVLHADETTLQVLHEPEKKPQSESYMGCTGQVSSATLATRNVPLYCTNTSRGSKHLTTFLEDYQNYLHTNSYAGYHMLPEEITIAVCWVHARRKFDEALKSIAKGHASAKNSRKAMTSAIGSSPLSRS